MGLPESLAGTPMIDVPVPKGESLRGLARMAR